MRWRCIAARVAHGVAGERESPTGRSARRRICDDPPMPSVTRLETVADLRERADPREMSVSARHEAVLDDGRRVTLLDDRGWASTLHGPGVNEETDAWQLASEREIQETARAVVGPDEQFGDRTQADMERDHWNWLADKLGSEGVAVDADELRRLPHDVVLSERLRGRLGRTELHGPA
jgi:hypothetical protein